MTAGGARPDGDWPEALAFLQSERDSGGFRVLWVGDPTVLPLDPFVAGDGTGYTLTRNGPGDARELWRAPSERADGLVGDAIELASDGRTDRLGHLVAPMGVRYVAMPIRAGPGASPQAPPPRLPAALASQLDLARLEAPRGPRPLREHRLDPDAGLRAPGRHRQCAARIEEPDRRRAACRRRRCHRGPRVALRLRARPVPDWCCGARRSTATGARPSEGRRSVT